MSSQLANWKVIAETRKVLEKTQRDLEETQQKLIETQKAIGIANRSFIWTILKDNKWISLDDEHTNQLETLFASKVTKAQYKLDGRDSFEVDFDKMTLKNSSTNQLYLLEKTPTTKPGK